MSTLYFLPWCRLQKPYSIGDFTLLPLSRNKQSAVLNPTDVKSVLSILDHFCDLEEQPVSEFTVALCSSRGLLADLPNEESASLQEFVAIACFSALADRDFECEHGRWSNGDCFRLHSCSWSDSFSADNAFRTKRRDGRFVLQGGFPVRYHRPIHTAVVDKIALPEELLGALWNARQNWKVDEWQKWREAIVTFIRANSESQDISWRVDWVLMCSAFQRILGKPTKATHKKAETVNEFSRHVSKPAKRLSIDAEILCEWLGEFCALRGDFAHGKRHSSQPRKWSDDQTHLSVAAIAFPLLVRLLLEEQKLYTAGTEDYAALAALPLFLQQERDSLLQRHDWWRIVLDQKLEVAIKLGLQEAGIGDNGTDR
ncbi:MAG: hypothetical protein Q7S58_14125 [Candidatus Binatus sp.]|uniref:hypothetical protein n=1 Tax=Candidatus Binatus sp. TaxID=2811406 RepID=UPI00271D9464|nr:hypothetical protein [Candidatus Binatus sp.]MDO8433538.1 hypothetical protein [Candidatus Binatus sp.]